MKSIDQIMRETLELIRETHGLAVTSVNCHWVGTMSNPNKTISSISLEGNSCAPNKDKEDR